MLIDNEKFIGLLVENSGIEKDKVEKYLEELVSEIKDASEEGDGYEIEGFGVFSKLGANILFIPSEELETEINYKYVGMEPIALPGGGSGVVDSEDSGEPENPIQGILDSESQEEESEEEYEDPFAELMGEAGEDEFDAELEEELEGIDKFEEEEVEESFDDLLSGDTNLETTDEEIEMPGPDKWGIDAHKEEDQENSFSGLLGNSEQDEEEDIFSIRDESENEESNTESLDEDEEIDSKDLGEESDDFDDPFLALEEEEVQDEEQDFVPVVTNVSSEIKENVKEDSIEESEESKQEEEKSKKTFSAKKKSAPVYLYMILVLIILGGTGYVLALLGIVNVKGITPEKETLEPITITIPLPQVENKTTESTVPQQVDGANNVSEQNTNPVDGSNTTQEEISEPAEPSSKQSEKVQNDFAPIVADEKAPDASSIITPVTVQEGAASYGLKGTATEAGNNGYTIVLYTLSRKAGADAQFEKLSREGYRVIIKEMPSQRYGALYRVSIGQFKSLAEAAIAAEKVDASVLGNYIISKI